ncbi:hypothetical protein [Mycobacterium vicinigordonae]|uniref:DUF7847 domain-containing protein n=1 Tax=Mycobacterium vicinigordonae TaxID=1719132 RepID=A0A7D6EE90_9MYCO|nr:hypothetical protein [Mycobacterium vicinigordonae]QLL10505.1 hypothetical protein H0P51_26600 [Mycobacterium vicinigordonae]
MPETLDLPRYTYVEKCSDRRQDGQHDRRRQPLRTVSTLPPASPGEPPPAYGPLPAYATPLPRYGPPPPGYQTPPPGYQVPPPGYGAPPPGYQVPPPGYGAPPPGYGPPLAPGYGPPLAPGAAKPGIIPLRPLTLSDIFNGAVSYIRANPMATLGLTAAVVVVVQVISLLATIGPITAISRFDSSQSNARAGAMGAYLASLAGGALVAWLGGILVSGMLTVVVGRAVFGSPITIGEAWAKVRGRLLALLGLALLEATGLAVIVGLAVVILVGVAVAANAGIAVLVGFPVLLLMLVLLAYAYTVLIFAPVLIVLERMPVFDAITRSFALVRNGFWRVLGIRLLASLVVAVVGGALSAPFSIVGEIVTIGNANLTALLIGATLTTIGNAISQIVTEPFLAGVVVLLYTDRRIRAEAFDLVLQTGAAGGPAALASTDNLWLTRPF